MKILDCTLRDGGYYTNWDFEESTTHTYFASMEKLPIDYIEIGYRSKPMSDYMGKYFYSPIYAWIQVISARQKEWGTVQIRKNPVFL